ncbi:MAG: hypothetical protein JWN85_254 [Gammaproteobacteria bacterium]|nr:hypothetical protein [Gammaproteobacteria bacterium]
MLTLYKSVPFAACLVLAGSAAFAQEQVGAPRAEGAPRTPTAPGVTRSVAAAPDTSPDNMSADSAERGKPETAVDAQANSPQTADDDQKMTPETATDAPITAEARKAAAARQGVRSNTPPSRPPDE